MRDKPLYKQIQDHIKEQISLGILRPGDRVPSEVELTRQFSVSLITAKNAVIALAEEGILSRFQGKGTFVAESTKTEPVIAQQHDKGCIGLIVPSMDTRVDQRLLKYTEKYLRQQGYILTVRITNESLAEETEAIRLFHGIGVKGLLILPTVNEKYNESILRLTLDKFPIVLIFRYLKNIHTSSVISEDLQGTFQAVDYLLNKGHRKIAFISPENTNSATEDRALGFEKAFIDRKVPIDKSLWCFIALDALDSNKSVEFIYEFFKEHPDITAVFTVNAILAGKVYTALKRLGRQIPQDVEMFTFDQPNLPDIPYVSQDEETICKTAVEQLVQQIEGNDQLSQAVIPVTLQYP
ncbi:GntR family transcriptional regulator [Cohnella endophytica]|uniref:GntR family transcriptional regulator n=1 Tax=Cohnella endophytica TaxID=2419778 RepID=A0A494XDQ8_9BACL|nr:GntR family transcriptional regulator [Cohnella endophytica]RKP48937.1 GntR family transcriptional regulator [Cohnella endophytica]